MVKGRRESKDGGIDLQAAVEIVRMNVIEPALTDFPIESAPGEIEPGLVDVIELAIGVDVQMRTGAASAMVRKRCSLSCELGLGFLALGYVTKYEDDTY